MLKEPQKLSKSLKKIRLEHKTVSEQLVEAKPDKIRLFLSKIKTCNEKNFSQLVDRLSIKDFVLIFPCISVATEAICLDRLTQILKKKASWHLYALGWVQLQNTFPNLQVFRALQTLVITLDQSPGIHNEKPQFIDDDIFALLKNEAHPQSFFNKFNQIYTGLNFNSLKEKNKSLDLNINSIFGLYLISNYLLECKTEDLLLAKDFIVDVLSINNAIYATKLLERILKDEWILLEDRQNILLKINEKFSCLDNVHPLFKTLDVYLTKSFKQHILFTKLGLAKLNLKITDTTTSNSADFKKISETVKLKLYQELLPLIEDYKVINEKIALIRIKDNLIIENQDTPLSLYFYTENVLRNGFNNGFSIEDFAYPEFQIPNLDIDNITNLETNTYCRLPLNETALPFLKTFLLSISSIN